MKYFKNIFVIFILFISGCAMVNEPSNIIIPDRIYVSGKDNSLWGGEASSNMLFIDDKARYKYDIITVFVEEQSTAQGSASTQTSNDSEASLGISSFLGMQNSNRKTMASGAISADTENKFKGDGKTARSGKITAVISATITEVLPNGNMVIEGQKEVEINSEKQWMTVKGIARSRDITPQNTVLSRHLAEAKIAYSGVGVINDKQHPGWAIRILDWIWPF